MARRLSNNSDTNCNTLNKYDLKDYLKGKLGVGDNIDDLPNECYESLKSLVTDEYIIAYYKKGKTPLEIAKDFEPLISLQFNEVLCDRFKVMKRSDIEIDFDYIKFAVSCLPVDENGDMIILKCNNKDNYGKNFTAVSGHVEYPYKDNINLTVSRVIDILYYNMIKELQEEVSINNNFIMDYVISFNWILKNEDNNIGVKMDDGTLQLCTRFYEDKKYMATVANTDIYGNTPCFTTLFKFYLTRDIETIESGEPDKHDAIIVNKADLFEIRDLCTSSIFELVREV